MQPESNFRFRYYRTLKLLAEGSVVPVNEGKALSKTCNFKEISDLLKADATNDFAAGIANDIDRLIRVCPSVKDL